MKKSPPGKEKKEPKLEPDQKRLVGGDRQTMTDLFALPVAEEIPGRPLRDSRG
jgi:hypothetical protein